MPGAVSRGRPGHLCSQPLPCAGSLSPESRTGNLSASRTLHETDPPGLRGSLHGPQHVCLTNWGCREGEGGVGDRGGRTAGVDPPLDGAIGPTVGRDAGPCSVRRVVDDVPRTEMLPIVGADTGCGEQSGQTRHGSGVWVGIPRPQTQGRPSASHPRCCRCTARHCRCKRW